MILDWWPINVCQKLEILNRLNSRLWKVNEDVLEFQFPTPKPSHVRTTNRLFSGSQLVYTNQTEIGPKGTREGLEARNYTMAFYAWMLLKNARISRLSLKIDYFLG